MAKSCRFMTSAEYKAVGNVVRNKKITVYGGLLVSIIDLLGGNTSCAEWRLMAILQQYVSSLKDDDDYILNHRTDVKSVEKLIEDLIDKKYRYKEKDNPNVKHRKVVYVPRRYKDKIDIVAKDIKKMFTPENNYTLTRAEFFSLCQNINKNLASGGLIGKYILDHIVTFIPTANGYKAIIRDTLANDPNDDFNGLTPTEIQKTVNILGKFFERLQRSVVFDWQLHKYNVFLGYDDKGEPIYVPVKHTASTLDGKHERSGNDSNNVALTFGNAFDNVARDIFMYLNDVINGKKNNSAILDGITINVDNGNISINASNYKLLVLNIQNRIDHVLKYFKLKELAYLEALEKRKEAREKNIPLDPKYGEILDERPDDWVNVFDLKVENGKVVPREESMYNTLINTTAHTLALMFLGIKQRMLDLTGSDECVFYSGIVNNDGSVSDLPPCVGHVYGKNDVKGRYIGGTFDLIVVDSDGVPNIFDFKTSYAKYRYKIENGVLVPDATDQQALKEEEDYNKGFGGNDSYALKYTDLLNYYYEILSTDPDLMDRMERVVERADGETVHRSPILGILRSKLSRDALWADYTEGVSYINSSNEVQTYSYLRSYNSGEKKNRVNTPINEQSGRRTAMFTGFEPRLYVVPKNDDSTEEAKLREKSVNAIIDHTESEVKKRGIKIAGKEWRSLQVDLISGIIDQFTQNMQNLTKVPVITKYKYTVAKQELKKLKITPEASTEIGKMIALEFSRQLDLLEPILLKIQDETNKENHEEVRDESNNLIDIKFFGLSESEIDFINQIFPTLAAKQAFMEAKNRGSLIIGGANDRRNKGEILRPFIFNAVKKEIGRTIQSAIDREVSADTSKSEWIKENIQQTSNFEQTAINVDSSVGDSAFNEAADLRRNSELMNKILDIFRVDISDEGEISEDGTIWEYLKSLSYRRLGALEGVLISESTNFVTKDLTTRTEGDTIEDAILQSSETNEILSDDASEVERSSTQWGVGNEEKNFREGISALVKRKLEMLSTGVTAEEVMRNPILYFLRDKKKCDSSKLTDLLIRHISSCSKIEDMINKIRELGKAGVLNKNTATELVGLLHSDSSTYDEEFQSQFYSAFAKHQSVFTELVNEFNERTGEYETYVRVVNMSSGSKDIMRYIRSNSANIISYAKAFYSTESTDKVRTPDQIRALIDKVRSKREEDVNEFKEELISALERNENLANVLPSHLKTPENIRNASQSDLASKDVVDNFESFLIRESQQEIDTIAKKLGDSYNARAAVLRAIKELASLDDIRNRMSALISLNNDERYREIVKIIRDIKGSDIFDVLKKFGFNIKRETFNRAIEESLIQGGAFETTNAGIIVGNLYDIALLVTKLDPEEVFAFQGTNIFDKNADISDSLKDALKPIIAKYNDISTVLSDSFEGVVQSGAFSNGKMRYTYINKSYITQFMTKLNGSDPGITREEFIEKHFDKDQFRVHTTSMDGKVVVHYRNAWLRDLVDHKGKLQIGHTQMISYNEKAYKEMTGPQYLSALMGMYFEANDSVVLGNTEREYAYFRVPIMSNKPAAEFIKFIKYNISEIRNNSIDIFGQEMHRISVALSDIMEMCTRNDNGTFSINMTAARDFFDINFENLYKEDKDLFEKIYEYAESKTGNFNLNDLKKIIKLKSKNRNLAATSFKTLEFLNNIIENGDSNDEIANYVLESLNNGGSINYKDADLIKNAFMEYMNNKYDETFDKWISDGLFTPDLRVDKDKYTITISFQHLGRYINPIVISYERDSEGHLEARSTEILKMLGFDDEELRGVDPGRGRDNSKLYLYDIINSPYYETTRTPLFNRIYDSLKQGKDVFKNREASIANGLMNNSVIDNTNEKNLYSSQTVENPYGLGFDQLRDYFFNDWFATYNIINLTSSDVAYFKDFVDFQKRNAQQHAPSVKLNKRATWKGERVTDGIHRQVIIEDFSGKKFKSEIVSVIEQIFKDKTEELKRIYIEKNTVDNNERSLSALQKEELNKAIAMYKSNAEWIVKQFKDKIDLTDGQSYTSPTSYRKKMVAMGKWSDEHEEAYKKIKAVDSKKGMSEKDLFDEISNIKLLCQPLKPFVYDQMTEGEMNVPIQVKNSEYMIFLAGVISNSNDKQPNLLRVLYRIMEESNQKQKYGDVAGIDTISFHSCVKIGASNVLSIEPQEKKDGKLETEDDIIKRIESSIYVIEDGRRVYNKDVVKHIDYDNYGIQQEVPAHYANHWQQMASQGRILVTADAPEKYTVWNGTSFEEVNSDDLIDEYKKNVATKIKMNIDKLRKRLNFGDNSSENDAKNFRRKISKILKETIDNGEKYSSDLIDAVSLTIEGEFRRSLNDEAISSRVQQLLNAFIRKTVNKTVLSGGPVVQVSNFGKSDDLHIRFRGLDGKIMLTKADFESKYSKENPFDTGFNNMTFTSYEEYSAKFKHSLAYLEAYAPIPSEEIATLLTVKTKHGNKLLNYDEAVERGILTQSEADRLSRIIGVRIPTEDAYSMIPIKVVGFLPAFAGEGLMLPSEITKMTGADFDIDKMFVTNESINIKAVTAKSIKKRIEALRDRKNNVYVDFYDKVLSSIPNIENGSITYNKKSYTSQEDLLTDLISDAHFRILGRRPDLSTKDKKAEALYNIAYDVVSSTIGVRRRAKDYNKAFVYNLGNLTVGKIIGRARRNGLLNEDYLEKKFLEALAKGIVKYKGGLFVDVDTEFKEDTEEYIDSKIFEFQWNSLTDKATLPKMFNPGSFEPQKKIARIKTIKATCAVDDKVFEDTLKKLLGNGDYSNLTLFEKLNKLDIDALDELISLTSSDNHNILFVNSQIYFFEQNMSAAKLIGTFANNNIAHTILQRQNIKYDPKGSVTNISLGSRTVVPGTKLDDVYDGSHQYISKNIAGFLAASVDAAKDPVLNFLNLNSVTVGPMMTLIRLGFDINTASLFMSQDAITEFIHRFNLESARSGHANASKTIDKLIDEIIRENKDSSTLSKKDLITGLKKDLGRNLSLETLFNAINSNKNIVYKVDGGGTNDEPKWKYNIRILLMFQHLITIAQDVRDMTEQCRFNSMAYAVGPNVFNSQERRRDVNDFNNRCQYADGDTTGRLTKVNFSINDNGNPNKQFYVKAEHRFTYQDRVSNGDQRIISNDRILSAYYYDIYGDYIINDAGTTSGYTGLERDLMSKLGFVEYNNIYDAIIEKFRAVSKYGLDDAELRRIKGEFIYYAISKSFYTREKVSDSETKAVFHNPGFVLDRSDIAELLETFPETWNNYILEAERGRYNENTTYALKVLSRYFTTEEKNEYHPNYELLNIISSNLNPEAVEDFKNALNILSMDEEGRMMAVNLFRYTMMRSGGHFNPRTAFHLFSTEFIETMPEYHFALNHLDDILDESDINKFFGQYVRNHNGPDDTRIVRMVYPGLKNAFSRISNIAHDRDDENIIRIEFVRTDEVVGNISLSSLPISTNSTLKRYGDLDENPNCLEVCPYVKYEGSLYVLVYNGVEDNNSKSIACKYVKVNSLGKNGVFVEYDANTDKLLISYYAHDNGVTRGSSHHLAIDLYDPSMESIYDSIIAGTEPIVYTDENTGEKLDFTDFFLESISNLIGITNHLDVINTYRSYKANIEENKDGTNEFRDALIQALKKWIAERLIDDKTKLRKDYIERNLLESISLIEEKDKEFCS